ncbi:tetratricopeptide repeat protein [Stella sp.]|uniref:tetratricopeptide repeat protein n=1 Tax=Stella sp. TaxID=2912054 RepID=UPI0035AEC01F
MAREQTAGTTPAAADPAGGPEARLALARRLLEDGDAVTAARHLRALAAERPARLGVWLLLARALIAADALDEADDTCRRLRGAGIDATTLEALDGQLREAVRDRCGIQRLAAPATARGRLADLRQPSVVARVAVRCPPRLAVPALERTLCDALGTALPPRHPDADPGRAVAWLVVRLAAALQAEATLPVFDDGRVLGQGGRAGFVLLVPAGEGGAATFAVEVAIWALTQCLRAGSGPADWAAAATQVGARADQVRDRLQAAASPTGNGIHFLRAAYRMGVPWRRYGRHAYQIGDGIHGRWLDSSLTDRTPSIAVSLAQDKVATALILRRAGLPGPTHARVSSPEAARDVARRLGYPVVVKPARLDGGTGVAAGLEDEAALDRAFARAREHSDDLLVEQHVDGDDYRLFVRDGRVTWAIERVPGGVEGDGTRTLRELLAALNADPRRGEGKQASLQKVEWDEEAEQLARRQGLAPDSVPAAGRFVRLRRITNVVRGGMPVPMPLARIHPANLRLAERAAAALRLDLAGIDFITPDIGRPWYEAGGVINEVNARPSLGLITAGHLFPEIVGWLLGGGDGRVPIVAILGDEDGLAEPLARRIHAGLLAQGLRAGLATAGGAWIGDERVAWDDRSGEPGGALLLTDSTVEAAVLTVPPETLAVAGAPFDRCSVVVRLGGGTAAPDAFEAGFVARAMQAVVAPAAAMPRLAGCGAARPIAVETVPGEDAAARLERLAAAVADGLAVATARDVP